MADIFDRLRDWLIEQALMEDPFDVTLNAFAARLLDAGVPVARISVGQVLLHPVIGLLDTEWDGSEMLLQARAMDETGYVQPTKSQLREVRGENSIYHNNCIQTWHVKENGEAENVEVS